MWKILIDILHVLAGETVEYVLECSYILMSSVNANTVELGNANKFTMFKKKGCSNRCTGVVFGKD